MVIPLLTSLVDVNRPQPSIVTAISPEFQPELSSFASVEKREQDVLEYYFSDKFSEKSDF